MASLKNSDCQRLVYLPLFVLGIFLLFVSLLGLIGSCCRVSFFLWIYLFFMFLLIVALFSFSIFVLVVTNKSINEMVTGKGYMEYKIGDYSKWLQKQVRDGDNWVKIKSCLHDVQVCRSLGDDMHPTAAEFYKEHLTLVQSGCCKPPAFCGFLFENATVWNPPKTGPANNDSDCTTWANDQDLLCYDCKSCKAGVLATLSNDWRKLAFINIFLLIILNIIYSIGCCALSNNRRHRHRLHYGYGYGHGHGFRPYYH